MSQVIEAILYLLHKKGIISDKDYAQILPKMFNGADPLKIAEAIRKVADGLE